MNKLIKILSVIFNLIKQGRLKACIKKIIKSFLNPPLDEATNLSHKITTEIKAEADKKLLRKIKELDPWFYPLKIKNVRVVPGIGSNQPPQRLNDRTLFREHLIVGEVIKRYDLKDKSILEVASNMGYWSSRYVQHGARRVVGIEGRDLFIKQAELYWSTVKLLPKNQYKFILGNVLDKELWARIVDMGPFDVTLCTGILYHLPDYRYLLEMISKVTKDLIVIDSRVSKESEQLSSEPGDLKFNSIEQTRERIIPNIYKLMEYIELLKFNPELIEPRFIIPQTIPLCDDYNVNNRVTIICSRNL